MIRKTIRKIFPDDKAQLRTNILNIIFLVFLCELFRIFLSQLLDPWTWDSWKIADFLVNYQGGFVRRGLSGEILFFFVDRYDLDIVLAVKTFCLICFVFVCWFFIRSFRKKGYVLYLLPLCIFLGAMVLGNYWARKDLLMLCFFIAIIWLYQKKASSGSMIINIVCINCLTAIILLIHEVYLFWGIPILFLLLFHHYRNAGKRAHTSFWYSTGALLPSFIVVLLVFTAHGDKDTAQTIWDSWRLIFGWQSANALPNNAIEAIGWTTSYALKLHASYNFLAISSQKIISVFYWAVIFPVIYYLAINTLFVFRKQNERFTENDRTVLSAVVLFQAFCLLPVFMVLSLDYMRLIFYWMSSSFVIYLLVSPVVLNSLFPNRYILFVTKTNNLINSLLPPTKSIVVLFMLLVNVGWSPFNFSHFFNTNMFVCIMRLLSLPLIKLTELFGFQLG